MVQQRFSGGSFDGQYIHLKVPDPFAKKLLLEKDFTNDVITWDIADRVELESDDTKNQSIWVNELDTTLQSIMKKHNFITLLLKWTKHFLNSVCFLKHVSWNIPTVLMIVSNLHY